jgi:hypothetical protein
MPGTERSFEELIPPGHIPKLQITLLLHVIRGNVMYWISSFAIVRVRPTVQLAARNDDVASRTVQKPWQLEDDVWHTDVMACPLQTLIPITWPSPRKLRSH